VEYRSRRFDRHQVSEERVLSLRNSQRRRNSS
jgi:hypothetical protein